MVNQVIIVVLRHHVFGRRKISSVLEFIFGFSTMGQDRLAAGVGDHEVGRGLRLARSAIGPIPDEVFSGDEEARRSLSFNKERGPTSAASYLNIKICNE